MNIHYIFVLILVWMRASYGEKALCGDVAFLIDTSSSMSIAQFDTEKEFVQKIIEQFDIGPEKTQVAALKFGNKVQVEFNFNEFQTSDDMIEKVGEMKHEGQDATYTDKALKSMQSDLFTASNGARNDVPKIGILLSDGASTRRSYTLREATKAKNAGYTLLAIGVGNVNKKELETVVSAPADKNFFYVKTFEDLKSSIFQQLVSMQACKAAKTTTTTTTQATTKAISTPQPVVSSTKAQKDQPDAEKECQGKSADVVFVIDMSSSIYGPFFTDSLRFVNKVIDIFDVDSGKTQIGALSFSDDVSVAFELNTYNNKADISEAILNIPQEIGNTYTNKALDTVANRMFAPGHGSRPSVAHVCILMTDGESRLRQKTLESAETIKNMGVYMFTIGVGNKTNTAELTDLASKPTENFMFEVNGFNALPKIKDMLAYQTCKVPQGTASAYAHRTKPSFYDKNA